MVLSDSDHGRMRDKLGELGPALARAASEAKPKAAAEIGRMADEADDHWKTIGNGPDLQVANNIRALLTRVITFKRGTGPEWRRARELASRMDDYLSDLPL